MAPNCCNFITCEDAEFSRVWRSFGATRTIWERVSLKRSFETVFKWTTTKTPVHFRSACQHRYGYETNDDFHGDQRMRQRFIELPFKLFCFLGPYLTPSQLQAIDDNVWHHFVSDVSAHVSNLQIPIEFEDRASKVLGTLPTVLTQFKAEMTQKHLPQKALLAIELKRNLAEMLHQNMGVEELIQRIDFLSTKFERKLNDTRPRSSSESRQQLSASRSTQHEQPLPPPFELPLPTHINCAPQPNDIQILGMSFEDVASRGMSHSGEASIKMRSGEGEYEAGNLYAALQAGELDRGEDAYGGDQYGVGGNFDEMRFGDGGTYSTPTGYGPVPARPPLPHSTVDPNDRNGFPNHLR